MDEVEPSSARRQLVERIREARPDIALSTDIIVGFPGETEAEFEDLLGFLRDIGSVSAASNAAWLAKLVTWRSELRSGPAGSR